LFTFFYLALAAQPQMVLEEVVTAAQVQADQLKRHRDEGYLLSKRVDGALLRNLLVWDGKTSQWRAQQADDDPGHGARVRVVHLWADYCAPCTRDFQWLRGIVRSAAAKYKGRVQYLFLAENTGSESMRTYLEAHKGQMPEGPHYQDTQGQLLEALRPGIPSGTISLPATLLLDEQGVIRQVIVGPLSEPSERRPELLDAIERLLAL
jgi:hypothetical protein